MTKWREARVLWSPLSLSPRGEPDSSCAAGRSLRGLRGSPRCCWEPSRRQSPRRGAPLSPGGLETSRAGMRHHCPFSFPFCPVQLEAASTQKEGKVSMSKPIISNENLQTHLPNGQHLLSENRPGDFSGSPMIRTPSTAGGVGLILIRVKIPKIPDVHHDQKTRT